MTLKAFIVVVAAVGGGGLPVLSAQEISSKAAAVGAAGVSLRQLDEAATMSGLGISPNSRYVSVRVERPDIRANRLRLSWYILNLQSGRVVAKCAGGRPDLRPSGYFATADAEWAPDSRWLYFRAVTNGRLEIWRLGLRGQVELVVGGGADVDGFHLGPRGNKLVYWVGPSRSRLAAAVRREYQRGVILEPNGTQYVTSPLEGNMPYRAGMGSIRIGILGGHLTWLPVGDSGRRRVLTYDIGSGITYGGERLGPEGYRYTPESDSSSLVPIVKGVGRVVSGARSGSSGDVAFFAYRGGGVQDQFGHRRSGIALGIRMARTGRISWCMNRFCHGFTGRVVWRPGTDEYIFTAVGRGGAVSMYRWDPEHGRVERVMRIRGEIGTRTGLYFRSAQCPVTHEYAVCVVEQATEPPELITIGLDTGLRDELFDPNRKLRNLLRASGVRPYLSDVSWRDDRGLVHTGVLLRPKMNGKGSDRPPLVITSYDCRGFLRGGTGATTPEWVLWQDGFAVLCSNRDDSMSAPAYRSPYVPSGQVTRMEYMYDGWKGAVEMLAREQLVRTDRVGISGLSFTGETVNYVVTHHPRFAAAATAGHLDFTDSIDFYIDGAMGGRAGKALTRGYGLPDPRTVAGQLYYPVVSDALNAARVCAPLLVQTDEAEALSGIQYYGAMRLDHAPAEVIVFPGEAHVFWKPKHLLLAQQRNIDWFRFWLQGYVSPRRGKRARYARWERIRSGMRVSCRSRLSGKDDPRPEQER